MADHSADSYDYIFLGTGCATLSIVMRMIASGRFADKCVLLVDKEPKNKNDRTWCFWEKDAGFFEDIVHKSWRELIFNTADHAISLDIAPYQYKMIRGIDFYNHCFSIINLQPNIKIQYGEIGFSVENKVTINNEPLPPGNAVVFNSIHIPPEKREGKFYLLQHFKGWVIETETEQFNAAQGTLMDFTISQDPGTAFIYVLPLATNRALIEYTLFTAELLEKEKYDFQIRDYVSRHLGINHYKISDTEFGVIPMTNASFDVNKYGLWNIGTAGGQTKASTGYTFQFIQKQAAAIFENLIKNKLPATDAPGKKRFYFYDSTLLHILSKNKLQGKEVFTQLFKNNKAARVFKFLDNETSVLEELQIIRTLPTKEFLAAGIKEFLKMI